MRQLTRSTILWYHLYPGILLTAFFVVFSPLLYQRGIPPQLILLLGIPLVIVPSLYLHLVRAKKKEQQENIMQLIVYRHKLSWVQLILYSLGIIFFAFLVYGFTQPISLYIANNLLGWLPEWYAVQDFEGYSKSIITFTLICNLLLNGILAPIVEEIYFRGYLLPRMAIYQQWAPLINALWFALYHLWQPHIYLTLFLAMLPLSYFTWKLQNLQLAIFAHCGLNIIGALLSFFMLSQ